MKIIWSALAVDRVKEITLSIKRDNPEVARQVVEAFFAGVEKLREYPESGKINIEANRKDIRELVVKNHRIIYRLAEKEIFILTVRHARQLLPDRELK